LIVATVRILMLGVAAAIAKKTARHFPGRLQVGRWLTLARRIVRPRSGLVLDVPRAAIVAIEAAPAAIPVVPCVVIFAPAVVCQVFPAYFRIT